MPRRDGTGPMGMGPMTGRAMGYCAGNAAPRYTNAGFGIGRGRGFRRRYDMTGLPGRARCRAYFSDFAPYVYPGTVPDVDEKEVLRNQAVFLEKQLKGIRERLKGFEEAE